MEAAPIVIPVRFVAQGAAVQTTSRELGSAGIAVRCKRPPQAGARVSMALYLPGAHKPEVAVGVVGASDFQRGTFWADFVVLDTEARHRIEALLQTSSHDVRQIEVNFLSAREFVLEYASNLSKGGLFIETPEPPALSSIIDVLLKLPDDGPSVNASALVVHRVFPADAVRLGVRAGAGLQFIGPTRTLQLRLDRYMEKLAATPIGR